HLEKWISKSGIQIILEEGNKIWMAYQPPSNIHLTKIGNLELDITFSPTNFSWGATDYKANIEQKTYLSIKNICNQPLDECIDLLIGFGEFLSFAMTKPTSIISIAGKVDVIHRGLVQQANGSFTLGEEELQETQVIIMFSLSNYAQNFEVKLSPNEMLFLFSDVENNFGEIFKTWINKRKVYEFVFDLLMTTMYTPSLYLHYHFLNIIQSLEAYHTIKYEDIYQDKKVYEKGIYRKFLEILRDFPSENVDPENGISEEFRNALKGRLKFQTRFSLETKIKEILSDISSVLPNNFIGSKENRELFARRASETRNALTHHDKQKRKQAAKGRELFQLFHTLTVILQICLLRELNLTDDSIKILVERNRSYRNEWKNEPESSS
ncbi:HEPN domain-containing protein, partial [Planktothrix sp.]